MANFTKVNSATLDFQFDYTDWFSGITSGDGISSASIIVGAGSGGIVVNSVTHTASAASFWASSGSVGSEYAILCTIVSSTGRIDNSIGYMNILDK